MNFGDRGEVFLHRCEPPRRAYLRREIRRTDDGCVDENVADQSRREIARRERDTRRTHLPLIRWSRYNLRGEMRRRDHRGVEEIERERVAERLLGERATRGGFIFD